jgi:hypothetical protein
VAFISFAYNYENAISLLTKRGIAVKQASIKNEDKVDEEI